MANWWIIGTTDHPLYKVLSGLSTAAKIGTLGAFGLGYKLSGQLIGSTFNGITREADYTSNIFSKNVIPPLEDLFNLYYSQALTSADLVRFAGMHGADLTTNGLWSAARSELWQKVLANHRPHLPTELLRNWDRQGVDGARAELSRALIKEGFATVTEQNWYADSWEPLGVGELVYLYWLGVISNRADLNKAMWVHGYRPEEVTQLLQAKESIPPMAMILDFLNKGVFTEREARDGLAAHGYTLDGGKDTILKSRLEMPGVAGLYALGGRQGWNDVFASKWGLDDDMPPQLAKWAERSGLKHTTDPTKPYGEDSGQSWAKMLWRGQCTLPDMGLLASIIHRFRGNPDDNRTWSQPGYPPLRQDEVWDAMRAMGLPTLTRNYLGRLVYSPISMRLMRTMIGYGGWGLSDVAGCLQDNGLSPLDAARVAPAIIASTQKPGSPHTDALERATYRKIVAGIETAYSVGAVTAQAAGTELVALGIGEQLATQMLAAVDMAVATDIVRQVVRRAKSDVFSGRTTLAAAKQRLLSVNMDPARVGQIAAAWQAEFGEGRKHLATDKVLQLLRKGFLTRDQALLRLTNLGWAQADELLLLAEVQGEISQDHAKLVRAAEAGKAKEQRVIESTLKKLSGQANTLVRRLHALTPVSEIKRWVKEGIWSDREATDQLWLMGYTPEMIADMLKEVHHVADKSPAKVTAAKPGGQTPPATGA